MNDLAAPFRQLLERRLWPLAVILLAALAAVFLVLAKGEEPVPAPTASAVGAQTATAAATTPIVSLGDVTAREDRRKVLGVRKNPFKPTIKGKKADSEATAKASAPSTTGEGLLPKTDDAISDAINDITNGVTPGVTTPTKTFETYSLFVRFGEASDDQGISGIKNVRRLKALPNVADPVVIYLGLLDDHKTAVFLVDDGVKVQGDGRCRPDPANCQTLHLRRGETSFFDVMEGEEVVARYQLDLVKIKTRKTSDAKAARAAREAEAAGGREALRARSSRVGNLRYDRSRGVVQEVK